MKTTDEKLDDTLKVLGELKDKSTSKTSTTFIVALIGSITTLIGIGANYYIVGPALMTKSRVEERVALRKEGLEHLLKLRKAFEQLCLTDVNEVNKDSLINALQDFQNFSDKVEAYYPSPNILKSMEQYNDYVALKYHEINSSTPNGEVGKELFNQSAGLYETARNAIDSIIKT